MNKTDFLAAIKCTTMVWHQARHESPPLWPLPPSVPAMGRPW